ncbi:MAG: carbohydrate kinase, partial [Candidatus Micrarchaeota archaeon]
MILAIGEVLIDFIGKGEISKADSFRKCFGGAPANVARGIARLGGEAGMLARVSDDGFGKFLFETLKESGVDVSGVVIDKKRKTRLAFVSVKEGGEREFTFYSEDCADEALGPDDIDESFVSKTKILHYGSIGMMSKKGEEATKKAVGIVKKCGGLISYDPNLRPMLWGSEEELRKKVMLGLKFADILKVDEKELEFITGEGEVEKGVEKLPEVKLACITLGKHGCWFYHDNKLERHNGYKINATDTTGAGDAFVSGLLFGMAKGHGISKSVDLANAV